MQFGPKQTIDLGLSFNRLEQFIFQDAKIKDNTLQTIANCLGTYEEIPLLIQQTLGEQKLQQVKAALWQYHEWIWYGTECFENMTGYKVPQETLLQRQLETEAESILRSVQEPQSMAWSTLENFSMLNLSTQQQQENWRSQVLETALYNGNPKLAVLMHYASIDEVKKVWARLQPQRITPPKTHEISLEPELMTTPSSLLMTYGRADDHKKNNGSIANDTNKINADIAALFTSDVAIQFLAIIRQDKNLIALINQFTTDIALQLVRGIQQKSLNAFQQMNALTRQAFLKKFAEQKALTLKKNFS
ncbi:hypothetical protein [Candidatus Berkiella aquae]|uniref:Uncharacterized protein n=1 Tax=Candidatus Berkiella aquae TaxID=295108 RepID=A0A0Q9YL81_9GAMM|nr:hypothetical protein [Candidatus Berkiella aquae]MCS5711003.1 hypothetical protein [Candidatus Berkiella aquae]